MTYREELLYLRKEIEEIERNGSLVEEKKAVSASKSDSTNKNQENFMDNITEKLTNLTIHDSMTEERDAKSSEEHTPIESPQKQDAEPPKVEIQQIAGEKAVKKSAKKPAKKQDIRFETSDFKNAHEDLITCIDICAEQKLIATGR